MANEINKRTLPMMQYSKEPSNEEASGVGVVNARGLSNVDVRGRSQMGRVAPARLGSF